MKKVVVAGSIRKVGTMLWEVKSIVNGQQKIKLIKSQTRPSVAVALGTTGGR